MYSYCIETVRTIFRLDNAIAEKSRVCVVQRECTEAYLV
jgi:hypothetical protein